VLCANQIIKREVALNEMDAKAGAMRGKILVRTLAYEASAKTYSVINLHR